MRRSFRLGPPEPRRGALTRPRLLSVLLGRWDHRVTLLVGGPGFGKSTLLLQAMEENRLAPRGQDVWIGVGPQDAEGDSLARAVAAALSACSASAVAVAPSVSASGSGDGGARTEGASTGPAATAAAEVVDALWRRAPTEICLIFDDVHQLPPGSGGARWLTALVDGLPANAHAVLASRAEPPVPLARLNSQGEVRRITEDELRFSREELTSFAVRRGIDPEQFADTGGWPAVAELAASVDRRLSGAYLWEEVLEPLGPDRRDVLSVLSDLGGADDPLAAAALDRPVALADELDGVPLLAEVGNGWYVPHALWSSAPGIALDPDRRTEVRRRAARHLQERGLLDEAFTLIEGAELWEEAPALLRSACLALERLTPSRIERWLAACPPSVRDSSAGELAAGLLTSMTEAADAVEQLWDVAQRLRKEGDVDAELLAIAVLARLAWTGLNLGPLGRELTVRLMELGATGHPQAQSLAALVRAMVADFRGDDAGVLAELATIEPQTLDPAWEAVARWLGGLVHLDLGEVEAAQEIVDGFRSPRDPLTRTIYGGLQLRIAWSQGRVGQVVADTPELLDHVRAAGGAAVVYQGMAVASTVFAHMGDVRAARRCLEEAGRAPIGPDGRPPAGVGLIMASLRLAEGDEEQAAATVHEALRATRGSVNRGVDRRMWRHLLPLSYVLAPETRAYWDEAATRGYQANGRDLAAAVVALRAGEGEQQLRDLDLSNLDVVRSALHHRFAAELAVGLAALGRPEGPALLEALGPAGRDAVRALGAGDSRLAKPARSLLGTVPAPPRQVAELAVLGPMNLRLSGERAPASDLTFPDLARKRLRTLLAFLVTHRITDRTAIMTALWPDLDERAASNNLAVTLTYVLQALEPSRTAGEPAYLVRQDGPSVSLITGSHLRIDADRFDHHLAEAARAEAHGTPSVALDHNLAAVELYRGELFADVPEADWMILDREHYRTRFVSAATRAGQLLLGRGDTHEAEAVARRALGADPWAEDAYAVLVAAAVANGDRSGAHRLLEHCITALADLGVEPSEATRQLRRRVQGSIAS